MSRGRGWTGLGAVCAVLFLTFLDNTVVSVILAGVQTDLHAGVQDLQWVVNGYMLTFASLMLAGGTLGDLLGRKRVMLGGVGLFCAGSVVCALAPGTSMLIVGRVIMGVGAAASEPGTLSVIRHLYPERGVRARALAAWTAVSGVALAIGPIIGGVIAAGAGWRGVFWLNLALGVVAFAAAAATLPENADPQGRRLDVRGLALGAVAVATATFAVIEGETVGYATWWIVALFALAVAAGVGFVLVERRSGDPVLRMEVFRRPSFTVANIVAFTTNFGILAIFFLGALYLQLIAGFSGWKIAVQFVSMAVAMAIAAPIAGRWIARAGPRGPTTLGCLLAGGGMFAVDAVLTPDVSVWNLAWALAIVGLGFGMALVAATSTVLSSVSAERSGMAASTVNTSREFGGVVGVALLGALVNAQLTSSLADQLRALGIPATFRSLVIDAVTHGGVPQNPGAAAAGTAGEGHLDLVKKVIHAADQAFTSGLGLALTLAGALLLASALIALVGAGRGRPREAVDAEASRG